MTRHEVAAAIRSLPEDERLELLGELWDSLDHDGPLLDWHRQELDRRLDAAAAAPPVPWSETRARILAAK
jgi:putative addiction module component (TIGR02574 family)